MASINKKKMVGVSSLAEASGSRLSKLAGQHEHAAFRASAGYLMPAQTPLQSRSGHWQQPSTNMYHRASPDMTHQQPQLPFQRAPIQPFSTTAKRGRTATEETHARPEISQRPTTSVSQRSTSSQGPDDFSSAQIHWRRLARDVQQIVQQLQKSVEASDGKIEQQREAIHDNLDMLIRTTAILTENYRALSEDLSDLSKSHKEEVDILHKRLDAVNQRQSALESVFDQSLDRQQRQRQVSMPGARSTHPAPGVLIEQPLESRSLPRDTCDSARVSDHHADDCDEAEPPVQRARANRQQRTFPVATLLEEACVAPPAHRRVLSPDPEPAVPRARKQGRTTKDKKRGRNDGDVDKDDPEKKGAVKPEKKRQPVGKESNAGSSNHRYPTRRDDKKVELMAIQQRLPC